MLLSLCIAEILGCCDEPIEGVLDVSKLVTNSKQSSIVKLVTSRWKSKRWASLFCNPYTNRSLSRISRGICEPYPVSKNIALRSWIYCTADSLSFCFRFNNCKRYCKSLRWGRSCSSQMFSISSTVVPIAWPVAVTVAVWKELQDLTNSAKRLLLNYVSSFRMDCQIIEVKDKIM